MSGFSFAERRLSVENTFMRLVRNMLVRARECDRPLTLFPLYEGEKVENGLTLSMSMEFVYSGRLSREFAEACSGILSSFTVSEMMTTRSGHQYFFLRFPMKDNVFCQIASTSIDVERTYISWDRQLAMKTLTK